MMDSLKISRINRKDGKRVIGRFIEKDGRHYFINGKNKIIFKEYFAKSKTAVELLENAIRFEGKQN